MEKIEELESLGFKVRQVDRVFICRKGKKLMIVDYNYDEACEDYVWEVETNKSKFITCFESFNDVIDALKDNLKFS